MNESLLEYDLYGNDNVWWDFNMQRWLNLPFISILSAWQGMFCYLVEVQSRDSAEQGMCTANWKMRYPKSSDTVAE